MTNAVSPAERYFNEVRHRAFAAAQPLRAEGIDTRQDGGSRLRAMLADILPDRFGVAAGTVISSNRKLSPVKAGGALIFDQACNSPMLQAIGPDAFFPIEMVLAVVSRIPMVQSDTAKELAATIVQWRHMAQRGKFYQSYDVITKPNGKTIAALRERRSDIPPRTFVIAETLGWKRPDETLKALKDILQRTDDCRLDGLLVLDRDWFIHQPDNKHRIELSMKAGTLEFMQKLVTDLCSAEKGAVSLARYAPD